MSLHTFHIPVMGIAFTIDTPLKVSQYGINSVISIIDDALLEKVRKIYSEKYGISYQPIDKKENDSRAKRITKYLNLVKEIAERNFDRFKQACSLKEAIAYLDMLPDSSPVKRAWQQLRTADALPQEIISHARENAVMGTIDVNIMTKVDKVNYKKGKPLPREYNDAHAALRGFALSDLESALVLSAGMNPSLYSYIASFDDFFPTSEGYIKKKIILKVSDYRSALIQGKFLAKKGLWVSEFRVESGLNCGGHAFASDGYLMGPILEEFRKSKSELQETMSELFYEGLRQKDRPIPHKMPELKITAQGGVGTAQEHTFLLEYYRLDAVGWGSPFLLVPEATCVDEQSRLQVKNADESDLYLSEISPLGVPFHNLRNNTKDVEKEKQALEGRPGSPCVKKYLAFNSNYTDKPICTASRKYQSIKIKELKERNLSHEEYEDSYNKIIDKSCICTGLGTAFLLENGLSTREEGDGASICPGPNIAYFDQIVSLKTMIDHIYGRINVIGRMDRPHMFVKELGLYLEHFKKIIEEYRINNSKKEMNRITSYAANLRNGIDYYKKLLASEMSLPEGHYQKFKESLKTAQTLIGQLYSSLTHEGLALNSISLSAQ